MIETELSRTGSLILKVNQKYTCSRANPEREAEVWIQKNQALWENCEQLVVIGAGSGIHIQMLAESFLGQIYVLDTHEELIEYHKNQPQVGNNIAWAHIGEPQAIPTFLDEISYFNKATMIVTFCPAIVARSSEFSALVKVLNSREFNSWKKILEEIPQFRSLNGEVDGRLHTVPSEVLSIKSMDNLLPEKMSAGSNELAIFKILRELVI